MNRDLIAAALALARIGLRPVPMIAAQKRPALKGWRERASCEPQAVANFFTDAPNATGLAVASGAGALVIDLDRNHTADADGVQAFAALICERSKGQALALGPRVRTPRGGVHLYFAMDPSRRVRNAVAIAPGVDVKGDGGLATCPPSPGYRWAPSPFERELPQAPAWLIDLVAPPAPPVRSVASVRPYRGDTNAYARTALERELKAVASAQAGGRNAALFKAGASLGGLCAAGMLPAEPVASDLFNAAIACGLVGEDGEAQARATIASGFQRGLANPRTAPGRRT